MKSLAYERCRKDERKTRAYAGADALGNGVGRAAVEQGRCEHKGVERRHAERAEELLGSAEGELENKTRYQEHNYEHGAVHRKMQSRGQIGVLRDKLECAAGESRNGREECYHRREHPEPARLLCEHERLARRIAAVKDEVLNEHGVERGGEQIKKPGHVHLSPSFFSSELKSSASSKRRLNAEP